MGFYAYYPPSNLVTATISGPVTVDQGTSPWVVAGTVSVGTPGQEPMAQSLPVTIASDQTVTPFALKLDNTSTANVIYVGLAAVGSGGASAVWQIKKVDQTSGLVITWAGTAAYNQIWNNRTSLVYS